MDRYVLYQGQNFFLWSRMLTIAYFRLRKAKSHIFMLDSLIASPQQQQQKNSHKFYFHRQHKNNLLLYYILCVSVSVCMWIARIHEFNGLCLVLLLKRRRKKNTFYLLNAAFA